MMDVFAAPDPDAIPTAKPFLGRTMVMRIDSAAAESDTFVSDLVFMGRLGVRPVVVHEALERRAGARLVGSINRIGGEAVGLDGASANTLLLAVDDKGEPNLRSVNAQLLMLLLAQGYIPILAAEGISVSGKTAALAGDAAAGALATSLRAIRLLLSAQPGGIPSDSGIISELTSSEALALAAAGTLPVDMNRHLTTAGLSVRAGVEAAQILDLSASHAALVELLTAQHVGTQVVSHVRVAGRP